MDRMECPDEVTADTGTQVPFSHGVNNRNSTKAGGDQLGAGLRSASYTNNTLNQITGRGVPSAVDVIGVATPAATVSVNGSTGGVYRLGDYFRRELSATNSSGPQWLPVGVTATGGPTNTVWPTGYVLVPPTGQTFLYDADGNLTNDAVWSYTWDAENRLVQMTNTTAVTSSARKKLVFQYDHQARRIRKTVYPWGATDYSTTPTLDLKFLYDNWNLLAELNATNNAVIRSCMWGLDLSGSEQGAGGVGGLLLTTRHSPLATHFVAYDGNGNVMGLVDANGGTTVAEYVYGTFAEPLVVTGPMGKLNPFRFSTKYTDDETDLLYYGYRYYSPTLGRWLNRDPFGEKAFFEHYTQQYRGIGLPDEPSATFNPYSFVENNPVSNRDMDGCRMTPQGDIEITSRNRRRPPGKMILIQVPKCTILFVYGHNWVNDFGKKGLQWIWNIVPAKDSEKDCSYSAVASCKADLVPNEIPLPGFSYSDYDVGDIGKINGATLLRMWRDVRDNYAPAAAKEMCKRCGCKGVTLKWERVQPAWFDGLFPLEPKAMMFPCVCTIPPKK